MSQQEKEAVKSMVRAVYLLSDEDQAVVIVRFLAIVACAKCCNPQAASSYLNTLMETANNMLSRDWDAAIATVQRARCAGEA